MSDINDRTAELNDLAALLVQTEPDDEAGWSAIINAIAGLIAHESTTAESRRCLVEAHTALSNVHGAARTDAALADTARLIERAVAAQERAVTGDRAPEIRPAPKTPESAAESTAILPVDSDLDLLRDFLGEGREYLDNAEAALLALESRPADSEAINIVFRAFHTIKGTSAFLGLEDITEFAHHAESLLSRVREGEIPYAGYTADVALRATDMLQALLAVVERCEPGSALARPAGFVALLATVTEAAEAPADSARFAVTAKRVVADADADIFPPTADEDAAPVEAAAERKTESKADATVRVRTDRLDRLVDMVGELVIAQTMIAQDTTVLTGGHLELARKVAHTNKMVRELQDLSMSMRMVPLKATFQKLTRLVRDVAQKTGKQVSFVVEGEDTEIDRNMVDVIGDPLIHMVRNAIDHGIEAPDVREAMGKPRAGIVHLSAYYAGGNVVVALRDDGKGLHRERIVQKALQKGLIDSDKAMSDAQVFDLIFAPGFSTAETLTDVSGRGVGMDVVKRNIESLRGRCDIASVAGQGSTFSIRLPLTLAITDGLLVRVGKERFIVPTIGIQVTIRPEQRAISTVAGRGEMVLLRDHLMPVVRLHRLFGIPDAAQQPWEGLLMIVGEGDRRVGLMVDELLGQNQVVVKSLGEGIGKQPGVAGGAILGDGRVGLILDIVEIAALAQQASAADDAHQPRARVA